MADSAAQEGKSEPFSLVHEDFGRYLVGSWKRTLEWREFGESFSHLRNTNRFVKIDEVNETHHTSEATKLKWSFGKSLNADSFREAYIMKVMRDSKLGETYMHWTFEGIPCHGRFSPSTHAAVLLFFTPKCAVVVTYRAISQDLMALNITEVDSSQEMPTIAYGHMCRVNNDAYNIPE